jgi:hypothetical protein
LLRLAAICEVRTAISAQIATARAPTERYLKETFIRAIGLRAFVI